MTTPRSERTEYVRLTLPAEPAQLGRLRHAMHEYLRPLPLSRDRRDEVVLAVGEAAANAVEHAYQHQPEPGVIDVTYWVESDALCVEIRDQGRWREPPPGPRPRGQGLGLVLMRRFIDCVLIHHDHRGTNVLLRHPMRSPAPDRSPSPPTRGARPAGAHRA
ncbi:ATP-binding protein [Pseudonocardia charpentierae]|uniref:ATP-binding protein n=1 Tax=Pseudonocardia charpentierae TaxID=3075545 RepID=A0ABU2NIR0_9PSEU|nr:ATP-binding protein [Pseudonocardia sp. DSM 45834]MDT0353114.1 ATP-binding protein [Pseudonocardia sp. DSM 45834]